MAAAAMRPSMGALGRISSSTPSPLRPLTQTASLSTTAALLKRHKYREARVYRDNSKHRGESAIHRSGTRWRLSMSDEPLPRPVPRNKLPAIETDPDHGLWEFFQNRTMVVNSPPEIAKHGRSWTAEELRHKSWDDLHRLWWVCAKERNRIATANWERNKSEMGFGETEMRHRDNAVRQTMRSIKHVLTERFYTWEDAVKVAENDPEVDLTGNGPAFTPRNFLEDADDVATTEDAQQAAEVTGEAVEKAEPGAAATPEPATIPSSKPQTDTPRL